MPHVSRLSQAIAGQRRAEFQRELQDQRRWLLERHLAQSEELNCIVCGCTENNACMLADGPCSWVVPGLCSNPGCVEAFESGQIGTPYIPDEEDDDCGEILVAP